jgi:hypothetical protein
MSNSEIITYESADGVTNIETRLENETAWLTQARRTELFGKGRTTITEHNPHIFSEGELSEDVVCREFRQTTKHGAIEGKTQTKSVKYYNFDVIKPVGDRVKSRQGTKYRQGIIFSKFRTKNKEKTKNELSEAEKHFIASMESVTKNLNPKKRQ